MSELNNPLLAGGFDGTVDLDALHQLNDPFYGDENRDGIPDHWNQELAPLHTNHRGYIGEDGNIYRKEITVDPETGEVTREYTDERLYFWTPPQELGDRGLNGNQEEASAGRSTFGAAGLYTKSEIAEAFNADQGMGYLKKANPGLTFDKYFSFIERTTELFTDPEYNDMTDGNMSAGNFQDSPEYMALMEEYGIKTQYVNEDGDVFNWNGTGYSKDFKVDDSIGIDVINKMALGLIGGVVAGPLLAGALAPTMGTAAAKAAANAIVSMASQYMTDGEVDFGAALISAATAYGGAKMGDLVGGSNIFGEVGEQMSDVAGKFEELISTGNSIADAAIKAGGMSLLTQFVMTGEIDPMQAGMAALMAGGTQAFQEWTTAMYDSGQPVSEGLLEEITVEAKRVGNDLGNGMYELDGVVFSETGGYLGNMSDLDLNGDGLLSGDDLQNIQTPDRDLVDTNAFGYEMGDDVYVDANGNPVDPDRVKFGPNGYTYDGEPVSAVPYNEVYGGDRGGLVWNDEGNEYFLNGEVYDGEIVYNEDGYPSTPDGQELAYTPRGDIRYENGELAYQKVDGQWVDADGNIIDDPQLVDELTGIAAGGIDDPLNRVQYFDQDGNPVKFGNTPLRDGYENGQYAGTIYGRDGTRYDFDPKTGLYKYVGSVDNPGAEADQWYDPITNTTYEQDSENNLVVTKVDSPPTEDQNPTDDTSSDPSGDPNEDTDASGTGSGGGTTPSTGGTGTEGASGGGGTEGGGTEGGASGGGGGGDEVIVNPFDPILPPLIPGLGDDGSDDEGSDGTDGGDSGDTTTDTTGDTTGDTTDGTGEGPDGTTDGTSGGDGTGTGTGGTGGGTSVGTGGTGGSQGGDGTGTGETGGGTGGDGAGDTGGTGTGTGAGTGGGGGTGGGTGGGSGGGSGGGTGTTTGPTYGTVSVGPGGPGTGLGGGGLGGLGGDGGGMMSGGGDYTPQWGELFAYTTLTPYQKKALEPYRNYIKEAKGMLS